MLVGSPDITFATSSTPITKPALMSARLAGSELTLGLSGTARKNPSYTCANLITVFANFTMVQNPTGFTPACNFSEDGTHIVFRLSDGATIAGGTSMHHSIEGEGLQCLRV